MCLLRTTAPVWRVSRVPGDQPGIESRTEISPGVSRRQFWNCLWMRRVKYSARELGSFNPAALVSASVRCVFSVAPEQALTTPLHYKPQWGAGSMCGHQFTSGPHEKVTPSTTLTGLSGVSTNDTVAGVVACPPQGHGPVIAVRHLPSSW